MKKLLFISLALIMCIGSSWAGHLSGERFSETKFQGRTINAVEASAMWQVEVTQGPSTGVAIDVPKELAQYAECRLEGDRLVLRLAKCPIDRSKLTGDMRMTARVTVSSLRSLVVSSAANVQINSPINNGNSNANFDISSMGKATTNGAIKCAELNVTLSGAASLGLQSVDCNGNAQIDCSSMSNCDVNGIIKCAQINVKLAGAANLGLQSVDCNGNAQIYCSSMSSLFDKGTLTCQKLTASLAGSSRAEIAKIETNSDTHIECGSMSQMSAEIACKGQATFATSGSSIVKVKGSALSAQINSSSMSSYYGAELITSKLNVVCSGSSVLQVYVDDEGTSDIDCSSMSTVTVNGMKKSQQHKVKTNNSGQITYL